jgi:hypothetical protein
MPDVNKRNECALMRVNNYRETNIENTVEPNFSADSAQTANS